MERSPADFLSRIYFVEVISDTARRNIECRESLQSAMVSDEGSKKSRARQGDGREILRFVSSTQRVTGSISADYDWK